MPEVKAPRFHNPVAGPHLRLRENAFRAPLPNQPRAAALISRRVRRFFNARNHLSEVVVRKGDAHLQVLSLQSAISSKIGR